MSGRSDEIERIANVVGNEGKLNQRAQVPMAWGLWRMVESVNSLITASFSRPPRLARAIGAGGEERSDTHMAIEFERRPRPR